MHGHTEGKAAAPGGLVGLRPRPGLSVQEHDGSLDIDVAVALDPPPDPAVWGSRLTVNATPERTALKRWARSGRSSFPTQTEWITATLTQITISRPGAPPPSTSSACAICAR